MERLSWLPLVVSQALAIALGLVLVFTPFTIFNPEFEVGRAPTLLRVWGATLTAFNVLALAVTLTSFRSGERWSWWALFTVPLLYLSWSLIDRPHPGDIILGSLGLLGLLVAAPRLLRRR